MQDTTQSAGDQRRTWVAHHANEDERSLLSRDERTSFSQSNSTPALLSITAASGIWITDASGNRYSDFYGNNCHHVGYQHPHVLDRVRGQLDRFCFVSRGLTSHASIELAELLIANYPDPESKVLFVPGGSAAVELGLMIAKVHTGRFKTVSFLDSYHGRSAGALSIGGAPRDHSPRMGPLVPGALHVPPFYWFARDRNASDADREASALVSLKCMQSLFECEGDIAAVVAEPVRNGPHMPPPNYWGEVRKLCDRYGTLLVFDEIPTGLGKTGRLFNSQHFGVLPDMTLIGKALGGAIAPLAAVIASKRLDTTSELNLGYFTHEKNPLSAAAGLGTLEVLVRDKLAERAAMLGEVVIKRLNALQTRYPVIANTRCVGLMFAIDFDATKGASGASVAQKMFYTLLKHGVLAMPPKENTLSLSAPLIIEERELEDALNIFEKTLECVVN